MGVIPPFFSNFNQTSYWEEIMETDFAGIKSKKTNDGNIIIHRDGSNSLIPFYKSDTYSIDTRSYNAFIKGVEKLVRDPIMGYNAYIRYLKEELDPPLNRCMVYSNITDDTVPIEMHHGVIFTLYDYVEIITNHLFKRGKKFSTFEVAHLVMQEHFENRVQVIMLSKAAHLALHPKKKGVKPKFVDYKSCHGDIVGFLEKYYDGLSFNHLGKLRRYFDTYEENMKTKDSFFEEFITTWNEEIMRV